MFANMPISIVIAMVITSIHVMTQKSTFRICAQISITSTLRAVSQFSAYTISISDKSRGTLNSPMIVINILKYIVWLYYCMISAVFIPLNAGLKLTPGLGWRPKSTTVIQGLVIDTIYLLYVTSEICGWPNGVEINAQASIGINMVGLLRTVTSSCLICNPLWCRCNSLISCWLTIPILCFCATLKKQSSSILSSASIKKSTLLLTLPFR